MKSDLPFRFEVAWILHDNSKPFLSVNWKEGENVLNNLNNFSKSLVDWSKDVFENILKRKMRVLVRIKGV